MAKCDLKSAFRILPILPSQRCWLLMMAKNPIDGRTAFFVEKNLPFGASVSCAQLSAFSESLKHIIEATTGRFYTVTNYLDDFLFIGAEEEECNEMVRNFITFCGEIGCPLSDEKTEWATHVITFLGLLLNGRTYSISVPHDKIAKAIYLLNFAINKKKVTIKFVEKLTGTLNFLSRAIIPGRTFTRLMYNKLRVTNSKGEALKHFHHLNLGSEFVKDCELWKIFLLRADAQQLCRPFVDIDVFSSATTLNFYTDSSLNPKLGYGGIFNDRWICGKWGEKFILENKPSIAFLELFALVAAIVTWTDEPEMKNTRVIAFCDNLAVRAMVNNLTTSCPQCMKLIRILTMDNLRNNRRVFIRYVPSKENILADALSRFEMKRFWKAAPKSMNRFPDATNSSFTPVSKIWHTSIDTLLDDLTLQTKLLFNFS